MDENRHIDFGKFPELFDELKPEKQAQIATQQEVDEWQYIQYKMLFTFPPRPTTGWRRIASYGKVTWPYRGKMEREALSMPYGRRQYVDPSHVYSAYSGIQYDCDDNVPGIGYTSHYPMQTLMNYSMY